MRTLRHFGPPPNAGQPAAMPNCGAEAAADHAQNRAYMGACSPPTLSDLYLTPSTGVSKMRPKMVLYMFNMLHM